ncbi:uncharacterized protein LOC106876651 [Octopus bimaculoides]|nr:uncharacterized protein LOC106876651 [Octopus bimaculoides]|eukprot:XP_014780753.1 PREDICTED: uncharacterized serine-rich protein C215.13-like [Octopus bimaculoides]
MYADIAKTDYSECGPANATLSLPNNSPLQLTYDSPRYMDSREQDDVFLTLEHAKEQFLSLLQKMDIDALVAFDKWLKMMRISRNPLTGKVICRENAVVHSSVNPQTAGAGNEDNLLPEDHKDHTVPTISGVYGSFPNTNITVNITLSPQALMGQGPITVTANTASSSHEGGGGSGTHRSSGGNNAAVSGSNSLPNGIRCATSSSATTTTIDLSQAGPSTSRSSTIAEDRIHALAIGSFSHSKSHSARTSQPGVKVVGTNCSSSSSNSTSYEHSNQPAFPIHLVPNNASYDGSGSSKKSRLDMTAVLSGPTNLTNSGQVEHNQSTERSRFKRILPKPSNNYLRNPSSASHHGLAASSTSSSSSSSSFRHSTGSSQNRLASAPSSLSTSALTATSSTQNRYVSMPSKDGHSSSENSVIFIKQDPD